jgi:hypothetical protein
LLNFFNRVITRSNNCNELGFLEFNADFLRSFAILAWITYDLEVDLLRQVGLKHKLLGEPKFWIKFDLVGILLQDRDRVL